MRRLLWVGIGAGLGISGYRRATRLLRELSGQPRSQRPRVRLSLRQVRGVTQFVRDVREGMELYAEQRRPGAEPHQPAPGPTLGWQHVNGDGASHSSASHSRASHSRASHNRASHNGASAH